MGKVIDNTGRLPPTPAPSVTRPAGPILVVKEVQIPGPRGLPGVDGGGVGSLPVATLPNAVVQVPLVGDPFSAPLTYDQISAAFAATLLGGGLVEVGASVITPAFTSVRNYPVTGATLTNNVDAESVNVTVAMNGGGSTSNPAVPTTSNSFSSAGTFLLATYGEAVTFTLTAVTAFATKTATATFTAVQRVYYGVAISPFFVEAFIESLPFLLTNTKNGSYVFTAGAGEKFYLAYRSAYGASNFNVGGFEGGMSLVASAVPITNGAGFTENYDVYATDTANLGTTTVVVST